MDFFEKDLEEIIFNADKEKLSEKGLWVHGKLYRQFKIGNYGIADLIEVYKSHDEGHNVIYNEVRPFLIIKIYELKKETIGISSFLQSIRYLKGIMQYMNTYYPNIDVRYYIKLIGKNIDTSGSFVYLTDVLYNNTFNSLNTIDFYTYKYDEDGIQFIQHNDYHIKNEGF